ncbi:autotransporter outer membrane beta-barrel domain-containing protein [uncultured Phascolarctobacterium sp.]|uniref:autotransporter outer membrane beta-barrel domain-containing protein n=1 Tax=uncultured Phascolarctobacterium sp. TaxID=512296 RepID=UPI0015B2F554|nr:autotransporter outer membrane beta-barrel domain-containing protein [uncultured Phascolarctobacterium sp.]
MMKKQRNFKSKQNLPHKVLLTLMTGLLLTGINGTALAENKTVTGEQLNANTIGPGNTAAGDNWNVEVGNGTDPTLYGVSDKNAISVRDDATIHINKNATVTNQAVKNLGNFKTGANTIEVRSGADIVVDGTVRKYGPENMGEAINVHGGGNKITVNGAVIAERSAAIWFQDWKDTGNDNRNSVINNGLIQRTDGGNVIGTSGGNGIDFTNNGTVDGNLFFANGDDNLTFLPGSKVTGNIDGGGGTNTLTLNGDKAIVGDKLSGALKNFNSLTKIGTGIWEITGPLQGFNKVDVREGSLLLSGDNDGFNGKVTVQKDASLTAKAESLPVNNPVTGNIGNVDLTDGGTLVFEQNDNDAYIGQIVGDGAVIKNGSGTVALLPQAGANTYSGITTISGGALAIKTESALGTNSAISIHNGGLVADANLTLTKNINMASVASETSIINTNGHDVTVSGELSGTNANGTFIKTGAGMLTAANDNNRFRGDVQLEAGAMQIDGSGPQNFSGKVHVLQNAFLQGSGRVAGDVVNAGWLAPGSINDKFGTFTVGGTLTWYQANGFYVDTQAQAVWFDSDISSSSSAYGRQIDGNKGFGYGLSVETGRRLAMHKPNWSWTPQMQLVYSNANFDDFSDVTGVDVKSGSADSLQGRLGIAVNYEKSFKKPSDDNYRNVKAYGLLNLYHEFHDGTNVIVAGDNYANKNDPTWLGLSVGGTYNYGKNSQYSLYGEVGISTSAKNFGDSHVLRGEVGFRYRF